MPVTESTRRRKQTVPKLKESCDCCASAKVRCSREQPSCLRCRQRGFNCEYSISRRAGRQTRTISSDSSTSSPRQMSSSSASSYTGSPMTSPMLPPYSTAQRHNTSDSTDSSYFSSPQLGAPIVPQMLAYGSNIETQTLHGWDHSSSGFMDSPTSVSSEWGHLRSSFAFPTEPQPQHHQQTFEPSSPPTAESIVGSIEMSPRQLQIDIASLQQESYLFMETEAIKEELNLAANFIGTLEDRIDKGIGNFKMSSTGNQLEKSQFGALQNDCLALADSSHLVAYHFTAVDLRRRLQSIRNEIECIAGLSC